MKATGERFETRAPARRTGSATTRFWRLGALVSWWWPQESKGAVPFGAVHG